MHSSYIHCCLFKKTNKTLFVKCEPNRIRFKNSIPLDLRFFLFPPADRQRPVHGSCSRQWTNSPICKILQELHLMKYSGTYYGWSRRPEYKRGHTAVVLRTQFLPYKKKGKKYLKIKGKTLGLSWHGILDLSNKEL